MLLLDASTAVTQELYLDEKTMPRVYVIVSRIYGRLFLYLMNSKSDATYTRTYLLMKKQCLMFMLLLAASTAVTQDLYLDEKTMPRVYVIVKTHLRQLHKSYILMRKQCLVFMLLLDASTEVTQGLISR